MTAKKVETNSTIFQKWVERQPDLTREAGAYLLGIDLRNYYRWVSGETMPSNSVIRLVRLFNERPDIQKYVAAWNVKKPTT